MMKLVNYIKVMKSTSKTKMSHYLFISTFNDNFQDISSWHFMFEYLTQQWKAPWKNINPIQTTLHYCYYAFDPKIYDSSILVHFSLILDRACYPQPSSKLVGDPENHVSKITMVIG